MRPSHPTRTRPSRRGMLATRAAAHAGSVVQGGNAHAWIHRHDEPRLLPFVVIAAEAKS